MVRQRERQREGKGGEIQRWGETEGERVGEADREGERGRKCLLSGGSLNG